MNFFDNFLEMTHLKNQLRKLHTGDIFFLHLLCKGRVMRICLSMRFLFVFCTTGLATSTTIIVVIYWACISHFEYEIMMGGTLELIFRNPYSIHFYQIFSVSPMIISSPIFWEISNWSNYNFEPVFDLDKATEFGNPKFTNFPTLVPSSIRGDMFAYVFGQPVYVVVEFLVNE